MNDNKEEGLDHYCWNCMLKHLHHSWNNMLVLHLLTVECPFLYDCENNMPSVNFRVFVFILFFRVHHLFSFSWKKLILYHIYVCRFLSILLLTFFSMTTVIYDIYLHIFIMLVLVRFTVHLHFSFNHSSGCGSKCEQWTIQWSIVCPNLKNLLLFEVFIGGTTIEFWTNNVLFSNECLLTIRLD